MFKKGLIILLSFALLFSFVGCGSKGELLDDAKEAWTEEYGDVITDSKIEKYSGSMNESHRMMAAMILLNHDMDSDLDSYDSVYLVSFVLESGEERAMVIADGEMIIP
jgi:predicted small lipoprotein YifL